MSDTQNIKRVRTADGDEINASPMDYALRRRDLDGKAEAILAEEVSKPCRPNQVVIDGLCSCPSGQRLELVYAPSVGHLRVRCGQCMRQIFCMEVAP